MPESEHKFYGTMAALSLAIVLLGFAPTYYLRTVAPAHPLTPLIEIHGIVFTAWIVLYCTQTALAGTRRIGVHRRLGVLGAILAIAMVGVGYVTAIEGARRGHNPAEWRDSFSFLAVPIVDLAVFLALIVPAFLLRHKPAIHKRLMLLATLSVLGAALTRMPFPGPKGALGLVPYALLALACPLFDYLSQRRVHAVFAWGSAWIVLTIPLRAFLGSNELWHRFAVWLAA